MTAPQVISPEILLDAHGLKAWYGAAQILYDINLQVGRGEVVALMGRTVLASPPHSRRSWA